MKKNLIIAIIVALFLSAILLTGCKTTEEIVYDIRGTWTITFNWVASPYPHPPTVGIWVFSGSLTSGTFIDFEGDTGTYTVNGQSVQWRYNFYNITYTGSFTSQTTMSGTAVAEGGWTNNWSAIKNM